GTGWIWRLVDGPTGKLAIDLLARHDRDEAVLAGDRLRLEQIRKAKAEEAAAYFAARASSWDRERSLHVPEAAVERTLRELVGDRPFDALLDLGTGTGRLLELFDDQYSRALGIDASHDMLAVARANLARARISNAQVRHGDIYALSVPRESFDVVAIHQVLHYLADPGRAVVDAPRALRPGGRMVIVDFAPHELEFLREAHAHRRLGFGHDQMRRFIEEAGLEVVEVRDLVPDAADVDRLTVTVWLARDPRIISDLPLQSKTREVA